MVPLPPLQLSTKSEAKGASSAGFDNSGFVVNFGGANSVGGLPQWAVLALLAGGAWWLTRKR